MYVQIPSYCMKQHDYFTILSYVPSSEVPFFNYSNVLVFPVIWVLELYLCLAALSWMEVVDSSPCILMFWLIVSCSYHITVKVVSVLCLYFQYINGHLLILKVLLSYPLLTCILCLLVHFMLCSTGSLLVGTKTRMLFLIKYLWSQILTYAYWILREIGGSWME